MASKRSKSANESVPKRKKVVMSLIDKVRVLDKLRSGLSVASVGREFGVNESTIRSIRHKEDEIRKAVRESAPESAKVTSVVRDEAMEKMERRLSLWINVMVSDKKHVDTAAIRLKARQIYEHVTKSQKNVKAFSASTGWLARFKNRYGLKNIKLTGEAGSTDVEAAEAFVKYLLELIEKKGYVPEQVFNADETGLFYKQTGKGTDISKTGTKEDRSSLLFCTNARGDFECKPLMVYRTENPCALKGKNGNHMPVHWRWSRRAWMTSEIFWDWLYNCFIPQVKQYLHNKNLAFKVLLILDDAPIHVREELENAHPNVEVVFMPPNTTSAWRNVSQGTIYNCWKKVWPECVTNFKGFSGVDERVKQNVQAIMQLVNRIGGEGLEDRRDKDVADILTERAIELTNEELDTMAQQGIKDSDDDDRQLTPTSNIVPLTTAKIERWTSLVEQLSKEIEESDPMLERSLKFKRQLNAAFLPYVETLKYLRWTSEQSTPTQYIKTVRAKTSPTPSTSCEEQSTEEAAADASDIELSFILPSTLPVSPSPPTF